jgi:hypothetical protein
VPSCDLVRVLQLEKAKAQAWATGLALVLAPAPMRVLALLLLPHLLASEQLLVTSLSEVPTASCLSPSLSAHGITLCEDMKYGHRPGVVRLDEESTRT